MQRKAANRCGAVESARGEERPLKGVRVLDADPDLARDLGGAELEAARDAALAAVIDAEPGPWSPPALPPAPPGPVGILVLGGLLERDVELGGIGCTEILGTGDLLHPWDRSEGQPSLPFAVGWRVLEPTRMALLDGSFAERVAPWPAVTTQLFGRSARVMQSLAVHFAITCFVGLELRLFILLWHLADRFGHVESGGDVVVPLRLTHENLARLVRARRPSVTAAVNGLTARGLVTRGENGVWILHGDPEVEFERLRDRLGPETVDARADAEPPETRDESAVERLKRQVLNRED